MNLFSDCSLERYVYRPYSRIVILFNTKVTCSNYLVKNYFIPVIMHCIICDLLFLLLKFSMCVVGLSMLTLYSGQFYIVLKSVCYVTTLATMLRFLLLNMYRCIAIYVVLQCPSVRLSVTHTHTDTRACIVSKQRSL